MKETVKWFCLLDSLERQVLAFLQRKRALGIVDVVPVLPKYQTQNRQLAPF